MRLGAASGGINVEIGPNDLAAVTWSGLDGVLRYRQRHPRTSWSPARPIGDRPARGAVLSVGDDGTMIATRATVESRELNTNTVWATVRLPGTLDFSPWRVIGTGVKGGFDLDAVASRDGEGTVAWSGSCPTDNAGYPAHYVDLDGPDQSAPVALANSKCAVWNMALARDGEGRQYLEIGTWTGIRFAVREPGEPFPRMKSITNSYKRANGDLAVSRGGRVTLIWSTSKQVNTSYRYLTMNDGVVTSPVRTLMGPRMNVERDRDYRLDSAPLPNGDLFSLWSRIEPPLGKQLRWRQTFGFSTWRPGAPYRRPRYRVPINLLLTPFPAFADTAPDGSRLAWWREENDRGEIVDVRYSSAPPQARTSAAAGTSAIGLDRSFGDEGVKSIYTGLGESPQADVDRRGRVLLSAGEYLARLTPSGEIDESFGHGGETYLGPHGSNSIRVATDIDRDRRGRLLIARTMYSEDFGDDGEIMRVEPDGKVDRDFGVHGAIRLGQFQRGESQYASTVAVNRRQQIFAGGNVLDWNGKTATAVLARLAPNGRETPGFGQNGALRTSAPKASRDQLLVDVAGVEPLADGGAIYASYAGRRIEITRINWTGRKRPWFGDDGTLTLGTEGLLYVPSSVGFPALAAGELAASINKHRFYFLTRPLGGESRIYAFDWRGRPLRSFGRRGSVRVGNTDSFRGVTLEAMPGGRVAVGGALTPKGSDHNVGALLVLDSRGRKDPRLGRNGIFRFRKTMGWVTDLDLAGDGGLIAAGNNDFGNLSGTGRYESVVAKLKPPA